MCFGSFNFLFFDSYIHLCYLQDAETNPQFADLFQFEWFHNNKRMANDSGIFTDFSFLILFIESIRCLDRMNILPITHTLEISNAQQQDSGNYTCIVRNNQESITSQTAFLDVLEGFTL